jgi:AcrR family transcriptional regulator
MAEAREPRSVRERLLEAADDLFYREGVHTVGIDRVLERAGVAKASLYGTFGSKDELVRAYLEGRGASIRERTMKRVAAAEGPRARILAVFDFLVERTSLPSYRGCPFVNACAEGPEGPSPAREVTARYRAWRHDLFRQLTGELGARDPEDMSRQLSLLYDGALVGASLDANPAAATEARSLAERILDEAVARPRGRARTVSGRTARRSRTVK